MPTTTTNFGWTVPSDTDLVKDGAAAIRTALGGVDTSMVDLKGGTSGQVLAKNSNTDMDFIWVAQDDSNAIQNAIVDAKGDLISATAADTPARLAVGTDGHVLTADSTTATGLKWAAAAGGGKVLQVVQASTTTQTTIQTTTYTDTTLTATITPSASTSKVLVLVSQTAMVFRDANSSAAGIRLLRDSTVVANFAGTDAISLGGNNATTSNSDEVKTIIAMNYLDSPATTSATTYKTQAAVYQTSSGSGFRAQHNTALSTIILMEIGA